LSTATAPAPAPLRLYDLGLALRNIDDLIEEAGGELTAEVEEALSCLTDGFTEKAERIALLIQERLRRAEAVASEAKRLAALALTSERAADSLKAYLARCLEAAGIDRFDGRLARVSLCQNGRPSIRWAGPAESIPEPFRKTVVEHRLDGSAALEAHRSGTLPDGFEVVLGKHVRIR
jgi:hypothetical protein